MRARNRSAEGPDLGRGRRSIVVALMASTAVVALESTIVATSVPSIVRDIGGSGSIPWVFSSYVVAQAVTVPLYAKLADSVGRRPVFAIGSAIFVIGSILCGCAWSFPALIVFRALQGLGSGAVQSTATTIAGDIFTLPERARVQGLLSSTSAAGALLGPIAGGLLASAGLWRLSFFLTVPLLVFSVWMIRRNLVERVSRSIARPDYLGAGLLTLGLTTSLFELLEGGRSWPWVSVSSFVLVVLSLGALIVFLHVERRSADPILSFRLLRRPLLTATSLVSACVGAVLLSLSSFLPGFLQTAAGASPLEAGLALSAVSIGWPVASTFSGRIYLRHGFRLTLALGCLVAGLGLGVLLVTCERPTTTVVGAACFLIGAGLGLIGMPGLIAAQMSVEWRSRGEVTGTNLFFRAAGSAVGVAAFGAIANGSGSIRSVLVAMLIPLLIVVAATSAMPRDRPAVRG